MKKLLFFTDIDQVHIDNCPGWGNKSVSYKVKTLKHKAQQSTIETLVKAKLQRQTSEGQPDLW